MADHTGPADATNGWPRTTPVTPEREALDRFHTGLCEDVARAAIEGRLPTQDGSESAA